MCTCHIIIFMILVSVVATPLTDGHSQPQRLKARGSLLIGVLPSIHRGKGEKAMICTVHRTCHIGCSGFFLLLWQRLLWQRLLWQRLLWQRLLWQRLLWQRLLWQRLLWQRMLWQRLL
jgi:hypothetical protein